ncbi:MAG TPA: ribonuclease P protein component [Terriglobia bacterium]|nr:ribonuclease P protein component [Terriglobia bacterium]
MRVRLAPQAFPKTLRLLRRAEFRRVYEEGQRRSASLCTIFFKSNGLPESRLGITTPKQLGNAVVRNHMRRRLREVFRRHRLEIAPGWDIVLNPRPPILKASFDGLTREVLRLFPRQSPPPDQPPEPGVRQPGQAQEASRSATSPNESPRPAREP